MSIWFAYDFLGMMVRDYMKHANQCLINAVVIKLRRQPKSYLLRVREDMLNLVELINQELGERA